MFSATTVLLASPVYLRLAENAGPWALLSLIVQLQIVPTAALVLVDAWLERGWPQGWRGWRVALCAACLLALLRQVQVSFRIPVPADAWSNMLVAVGVFVLVGALAWAGASLVLRFLAACAPALLVWTIIMAYTVAPPPARASQPARSSKPSRPVFVLLFDELDRDAVMTDGRVRLELPNFARLAARAAVFADATANYGHTCGSVGSLLTGRLFEEVPPANRYCLRFLPDFSRDSLFTAVAERGFDVRLYAQYLTYCLDAAFRCRGTASIQARAPYLPLLEHYVPDEIRSTIGADRVLGSSLHTYTLPVFEQFVRDVRAAAGPAAFSWLHVLMPHSPYVFDADGVIHPRDHREPGPWRDPAEYRRALAAYRRQVGFVDRLLGRFLDRLEAERLADEAIVIVISDHGFYSLHPFAAPELVDGFETSATRPRVPLIVRGPGIAPAVVRDGYQHVDFKRLVLDVIDGADRPATAVTARPKVFCDSTVWRVRDASGRWQLDLGPDGRPRECGGPR